MKPTVKIMVPTKFKMDIVLYYDNGYPEFDLVAHGSMSDGKVIWTGIVKVPVQTHEVKNETSSKNRSRRT